MHNYKALKAASKASVQKVKVIDQAKVDEVKDDDGVVTTYAEAERSHEELQVVCKCYDAQTGEAQDDSVRAYSLSDVKREIDIYNRMYFNTRVIYRPYPNQYYYDYGRPDTFNNRRPNNNGGGGGSRGNGGNRGTTRTTPTVERGETHTGGNVPQNDRKKN